MILIIMGQREKVTDVSGQASCEICGLTARTKDEMKNILVTHTGPRRRVSSEQKLILFQNISRRYQQPAKKKNNVININTPDMM